MLGPSQTGVSRCPWTSLLVKYWDSPHAFQSLVSSLTSLWSDNTMFFNLLSLISCGRVARHGEGPLGPRRHQHVQALPTRPAARAGRACPCPLLSACAHHALPSKSVCLSCASAGLRPVCPILVSSVFRIVAACGEFPPLSLGKVSLRSPRYVSQGSQAGFPLRFFHARFFMFQNLSVKLMHSKVGFCSQCTSVNFNSRVDLCDPRHGRGQHILSPPRRPPFLSSGSQMPPHITGAWQCYVAFTQRLVNGGP